jgi:hypothetical protein
MIWQELHNLYSSPNIGMIKSRRMKCVGLVVCIGEMRNVYRILVGKLEGKLPLRRPRHRWEDKIKMDLWEMGFEVCIGFIWLRKGDGGLLL